MREMNELLKAAYAEGVKVALMDNGYSTQISEKVAQEGILPGASKGALLALLAGGAVGLGRTPIMRREFMRTLGRKDSGGISKALKELVSTPSNQEQIRNLAIPGAVGGGAISALSGN